MIYMYVYIVINLNIFEEKGSREQIWFYYLVERIQPEKLFQIMKFIQVGDGPVNYIATRRPI